ncbi:hypothetical protein PAL_GLEAN10005489 [Pteropus alecto]|uniref:Uncharacterized protein n=1 Tax=Pteropus alecto TaxID=9402 RepID=L5JUY3_PTEAL|nr:hypothetical protein PAL_GLEAN10005489 [Pteropus alecto]
MGNEATAGIKAPFLLPLCSSCLKNSPPTRHRELTPTATGPPAAPAARRTASISEVRALVAAPDDCPGWSGTRGGSLARGSDFHSLSCLRRVCETDGNEASSFV